MSLTTTELASVEAEQATLGACLLEPDDAIPAVATLRPQDFQRRAHSIIFAEACEMHTAGAAIDPVTLADALRKSGNLDVVGGVAYLSELVGGSAGAANVAAYAAIVRDKSIRRHALAKLAETRDAIQTGGIPVLDAISDLASLAEGLAADTASQPQTLAEVIHVAIEGAYAARERRSAGGTIGAPSGLPTLDARLGGLHGPRLVIPAGRPGVGKTALISQWALHAAARGFRVGICSLEMSDAETGLRALATRLGLNAAALARGSSDDCRALDAAISTDEFHGMMRLPIFYDFDSFSLSAIVARISQWRRTERIDFAIIDHIGLVEAEGFKSRVEQLGHISRSLKKLAKRLGIPIVAVSQLNRAVETDNRIPKLSDLRDSGNLEQDADIVLMLHAKGDPDSQGCVDVDIGLLKLRDGVRGWLPCPFEFDGRTQRFREIAAGQSSAPTSIPRRPQQATTHASRSSIAQ